ncbi:MAG TPA: hypothetical protein VG323_07320 [Thermoanaerobaculia bacterium]|nr:hypothetical protein [Thermoanaerobaculia bacterium]
MVLTAQGFGIGDGSIIERERGDALYLYNGEAGAAPIIFGETGDATLLGTVTLAALGLVFDPIRRVLLPLPMIVGGAPHPTA